MAHETAREPTPPRSTYTGPDVELFTYPPPPATDAIPVFTVDLFCLTEGEFLNDVIIDFYIKYLVNTMLTGEQQERTHVFSPFFYQRLSQLPTKRSAKDINLSLAKKRHNRVKTWTQHVDLFSKDFIVVPINESGHWYLAIVCFPSLRAPQFKTVSGTGEPSTKTNDESSDNSIESKPREDQDVPVKGGEKTAGRVIMKRIVEKQPCILVMDSLITSVTRSHTIQIIRDYLQVEWDVKKKGNEGSRLFTEESVKGSTLKVPQQNNCSDCGVYLLQYVEQFFKAPIRDFTIPVQGLENWFPQEMCDGKRQQIRQLLFELQKKYNPSLQL